MAHLNASLWGLPLQALLQDSDFCGRVRVLMVSETHVPAGEVSKAKAMARGWGWDSVWAGAVAGSGGGWSAGVAIFGHARCEVYPLSGGPLRVFLETGLTCSAGYMLLR